MTMIDSGSYGATRLTWGGDGYRPSLYRLIEENPSLNEAELLKRFRDFAVNDPETIDALILYGFTNAYRDYKRGLHKGAPAQVAAVRRQEAKKQAAAVAKEVKKTIRVNATRMVLLDIVLPNGKALRDATGKDCAKAGGWLTKVAAKVKANQVVGSVLSEAQVKNLFAS